jgi:hypothetical protein
MSRGFKYREKKETTALRRIKMRKQAHGDKKSGP